MTYRDTRTNLLQILIIILIILDVIFNLFADEYIAYEVGNIPTLKVIANTLIIPTATFISCIIGYHAIRLEYNQKIKIRIKKYELKKAIVLTDFLLIFIVSIILFLKTYTIYPDYQNYISIEYLVGVACFLVAITSAIIE